MSLQRKSFTNIVSPSSNFKDDVFVIKQKRVAYEQGFSLNYIDALSGVNDAKINNYSSLYLTDAKRDDEVFDFNVIDDSQDDYITYIKYRNPNGDLFLYYDDNNTYNDTQYHSYSFISSASMLDISRAYFEIETLNPSLCRIKRRDGDISYYLTYSTSPPGNSYFFFTTSIAADEYTTPAIYKPDTFSYVLDQQGYALFFKRINSQTYILAVDTATLDFKFVQYTSNFNYTTPETLFGVDLINNIVDYKLNTSWVSYDKQHINSLQINNSRSIFNLRNNSIFHFEYNSITDLNEVEVNTFKLKNQHTNKNISKRGNAGITTSKDLPAPYFREYTSLVTGNNEEQGYDDIGINYVFYNQDYKIPADTTTAFTSPSSIFPFTQLNINDTSFVRDGSLAAPNITIADKIYKSVEAEGDPLQGTYLVTWLSGSMDNYGMWLDRYYFPNIISQRDAISGDAAFSPTFGLPTSEIAYDSASTVNSQPYYDTISNFTVLPNESYVYSRTGNTQLTDFVNSYDNIIQYGFNSYITSTNNRISVDTDELVFNGDKVVSLPIDEVNSSGSFTLFFEIEGNWKQKISYIFGSLVDSGFAIYNDERITPFIYLKSDKNVYVNNINSAIVYSLSFDSPVLDIITSNQLADYFVTTKDNNVYRVGSDGTLREKYEIFTQSLPLTTGYVSYINYTQVDDNIYFLTSTTGDYIRLNTNTGDVLPGTVVSFMSGDTITRSLYVYDGNVYGFPGEKNILYGETLYTLVSGNTLESYNLNTTNVKTTFIKTNSIITDFNVDDDGNLYVIHDHNKLAIVDTNRKLLSDTTLLPNITGHKIDFVSYYTDKREFYPIILITDNDYNYSLMSYTPTQSATPTLLTGITPYNDIFDFNSTFNATNVSEIPSIRTLTGVASGEYVSVNDIVEDFEDISPTFDGPDSPDSAALVDQVANSLFDDFLSQIKKQPLTNYNTFINNTSFNYLNFTLKIKNIYNALDVTTISYSIPVDDLSNFSNTVCVMYDDKEGKYSIYVNSMEVFSQAVDKSKYTFNVLLNNSLVMGSVGYHNNLILSQFVKIPGFLYSNGIKIKGLRYFSSRLNNEQLYGLFIENAGVGDLYITLPCDQRNNVENIQSIFKLTQPYNKSNSINIIVKNTGITSTTLQNELSSAVVNSIDDVLPGDVNINNIRFIDY